MVPNPENREDAMSTSSHPQSPLRDAGLALLALLIFSLACYVSIISLDEANDRVSSMSWIETRLERLRSDYEDAIDAEDVNRQQAKRVELDQFETAQHRLMLLNAAGRDGQVDSLSSILSELPETNIDNLDSKTEWYEFAWIVRQSTNQILIFSMVACGIMGAIFSGVWRARQNAKGPNIEGNANWDWPASAIAKDTVVGAGAGLTVFLILSGGSVLFVFSSSPELLLNPYSGSLFAMLAGLFSEKAYGALAKRLDAAIQ